MGQTIELRFTEPDLWQTLVYHYNIEANDRDWPIISKFIYDEISNISCTVAGFYESSHGKFSEDRNLGSKDQILIEVKNYL